MFTRTADSRDQLDGKMLEIALKTILRKNRTRLTRLTNDSNPELLDDIAREITCQTIAYQRITNSIEREMDFARPHEVQFAGELRQ
jgi:hypothetical protein